MDKTHKEEAGLDRALGLYPATAVVVGSVIGSGIFVSSAAMARVVPSGWQLLGVWVFAGLMTALGALTQCELSSRLPLTGGLYEYFRVIFGDTVAFFYGWANLTVAGSGAIAALAAIFAGYLGEFVPLAGFGEKLVGAALILILTYLNVRGVRLGAWVQSASATAKTVAIGLLIGAAFLFSRDGSWSHLSNGAPSSLSGASAVGVWFVAMGGAFWSYDGWGNVASIAGEVKEPRRTLPRAILLGTSLVMALYLLVNLAYLYVLPLELMGAAPGDRVASAAMSRIFGPSGAVAIAALILLSTFSSLSSAILANSRVCFAMGNDGLLWRRVGLVHPRFKTPATALWLQAGWAVVLLATGSFWLIISMYVFVSWLFYLLIPVALFLLRRRARAEKGVFLVPGYPWVPLAFAVFTFAYLVPTLVSDLEAYRAGAQSTVRSLVGVALVLSGTPVLLWMKARARGLPHAGRKG